MQFHAAAFQDVQTGNSAGAIQQTSHFCKGHIGNNSPRPGKNNRYAAGTVAINGNIIDPAGRLIDLQHSAGDNKRFCSTITCNCYAGNSFNSKAAVAPL